MIYYKGPSSQQSLEVYTSQAKEAKLKKVKGLAQVPQDPQAAWPDSA